MAFVIPSVLRILSVIVFGVLVLDCSFVKLGSLAQVLPTEEGPFGYRLTSSIPQEIGNIATLEELILRNCLMIGTIPEYVGDMTELKQLFLTNNSLTGILPDWILNSKQNLNLVSSFSPSESNEISWCLKRDLACSGKPEYHSLFINCGGHKMTFENNEYEEDVTPSGPSTFIFAEKWAYSSTGLYMGNDSAEFIARTSFGSNVTGARLYESARLAPQSLKYYGLWKCSLKDFNIMEKAGGARISHVEEFDNILVNGSSTLEIHLYWLGKGTTAIPTRSVYGPLISAITVTPNFKVDDGGLLVAAIIGIVATSCFVVVLILLVLRRKGYLGVKDLEDKEFRGLDLQTGYFSLRQIKQATNSFDVANQIGEGGFGPVYKGVLPDGTIIAVKQLSSKSKQGNREFVNEIGMISALQHPNLVRLYGCCIEGNQLLLVYEYLENNSLARALFGREEQRLEMDWPTRKKILLGIAKGLAYLHEESRLKIVHRDIKATNVLLDKDLNAKISDFGLAKLDEEENTHISTRIAGTVGYMAPEYAMRGYLTDKADVYSFGVVGLEIAYVLQEQGNLLELVDPNLGSNYSKQEAMSILNLALLCTNPSPTLRPSMSSVVSMVEGEIPVQALIIKRGSMDQDAKFKAFEILSHNSQTHIPMFSQDSQDQRGVSSDGPWLDSSISSPSNDESREHSSSRLLKDLYDVKLEHIGENEVLRLLGISSRNVTEKAQIAAHCFKAAKEVGDRVIPHNTNCSSLFH
ncbi:hypothetical protein GH714_026276 [Hevea brasiliensis]|uniref:non-specific serine/threonine protein kinase n=1 Tax=Hevea brasiliensis TaxID=3981 RepID=A0A6A6MQG4_HEVBR|nr:hypothetical protein GH714_026276 [Hevea brasiliensis]